MKNTIEFLQNVELFSLLTIDEIRIIINSLHPIDIENGEILFKEGDEGNELYIIQSGKVASSVMLPNGNKREVAVFEKGDFFGEMSIFENSQRSATCYTKEKCHLLILRERELFELILYNPEIAIKIMYRMLNITTERLLDRNEFLSDMVHWGEEARKRAITDELTGIYNRRFLDDALEDHFTAAKNTQRPLSLIMIDIDHFQNISETYNQEEVNLIILEIVSVFKKYFREKDIIAKYGGDEFSVIMPDTDLNEAKNVAINICRYISELNMFEVINKDVPRITISQGIASYPENANDIETLRSLADQSMYKAKEEGRNRVVCAASCTRI